MVQTPSTIHRSLEILRPTAYAKATAGSPKLYAKAEGGRYVRYVVARPPIECPTTITGVRILLARARRCLHAARSCAVQALSLK